VTEEKEEAEVVRGLLPFTIGDATKLVPELKWRENRDWQDRLQATFLELATVPIDTPDGLQKMGDAERALVLAYDRTGMLGDLEDATEREIDVIYNRLIEVAFPLAQSQTALMVSIMRAAAGSVLANSTNGRSATGATATPTTLKDHLPSAKPSSSSRKRRSG